MNSKVRALIWEECRTGGVIAAWCLACGSVLVILFFISLWTYWSMGLYETYESALFVTVCVPLVACLLVTLNPANTGHLRGGFSERILRLPVGTSAAVLAVLLSRLIMVLAVATGMTAVCRHVFGWGPDPRMILVFLVAELYLIIQTLDWLRGPAPLLSLGCGGGMLVWLFAYRATEHRWPWVGFFEASYPVSMGVFVASLLAAYVISVSAVRATRCGQRMAPLVAVSLEGLSFFGGRLSRKPFRSPVAARVWFEMRRTGAYLPVMVVLYLFLAVLARWLVILSGPPSEKFPSRDTPYFTLGPSIALSSVWLFEIMPYAALVLAVFSWAPLFLGMTRKSRTSMFPFLQPIRTAQIVQARLIAAGTCLGMALLAIAVMSSISFLLGHDGIAGNFIFGALAHGETNLREVLAYLLGLPILVGLASWIGLSVGTRASAVLGAMVMVVFFAVGVAEWIENKWIPPVALVGSWFLVLFLIALTGGTAFSAWRRGLVSGKSLAVCGAVWAGVALFLYPFSSLMVNGRLLSVGGLYGCVGIGALVLLPYFALVLDVNRRRHGADVFANPHQHQSPRTCSAGILPASVGREEQMHAGRMPALQVLMRARVMRWGVVAVVIAFLAWLRWPSEPAFKAAWRSRGLPTTPEELDAWYPRVDRAQNLALKYVSATALGEKDRMRWVESFPEPDEKWAPGWRIPSPSKWEAAFEHVLIQGEAKVGRTETIPDEVWRCTMDYWDKVGRGIAVALHEAAASGLKASRYPMDLSDGPYVLLPHLARLRHFGARTLQLEALIASVEKRPAVAAEAALAILPIANSLDAEPLLSSQLMRIAVLHIAVGSVETAMNRCSFRAEELERLQKAFATALPPADERLILDRAMIGEVHTSLWVLDEGYPDLFWSGHVYLDRYQRKDIDTKYELYCLGLPLWDVLNIGTFERIAGLRYVATLMENAHGYALTGGVEVSRPAQGLEFPKSLFWRAPVASVVLPGLERGYEAEWRIRTILALAQTALAVERFRLAHGRLPEQLEVLVPEFLDSVACDPWNDGRPVSYRIKDNGEFVVYSFALNRTDDGGEELSPPSQSKQWEMGDLTFTVAPPEVRDRPQVAVGGMSSSSDESDGADESEG